MTRHIFRVPQKFRERFQITDGNSQVFRTRPSILKNAHPLAQETCPAIEFFPCQISGQQNIYTVDPNITPIGRMDQMRFPEHRAVDSYAPVWDAVDVQVGQGAESV